MYVVGELNVLCIIHVCVLVHLWLWWSISRKVRSRLIAYRRLILELAYQGVNPYHYATPKLKRKLKPKPNPNLYPNPNPNPDPNQT
jgi:hypothetical protein